MNAQQGTVSNHRRGGGNSPWGLEDEPEYRIVLAGGAPAMLTDGRPIDIAAAGCRAVTLDRAGASQCRRTGCFALQEPSGVIIRPLCATHLRRLAGSGGPVLA